jgi:outer membrane receptor protein involved in Fe transport
VQTFRDIPARTIVNTRIGWQNDHVGAYLFVSNLFNVQKPVYSFVDFDGRTRGLLSDPRMAGISFEGRF